MTTDTPKQPDALPEPVAYALHHKRGLCFEWQGFAQPTRALAEDMQRRHMGNPFIVVLYTEGQIAAALAAQAEKHTQERAALMQELGECSGGYQTLEREVAALHAQVDALRQGEPVARPLEWDKDGGQWNDKHHGFSIMHDDDDEPEPYAASWGEGDSAQFPSLIAAQAWCQEQIDDWVSRHVVLASPPPAQPTRERLTDEELADCGLLSELAPQPAPSEPTVPAWVSCAERMPISGVTVLACYTNRSGNVRRIRAEWVAAKTIESDGDSEIGEYDEATDCCYDPEGWYEKIDNWGDYSSVVVNEGEVTHWMPLPAHPDASPPPAQPAQAEPVIETIVALKSDEQASLSPGAYQVLTAAAERVKPSAQPAQPEPVAWANAAEWLRNHYQDHPTIDGLCSAMRAASPPPAQAEFHNPWRTSLENCISGDNYLRASEYCDLIEELDKLYRLRAAQPPREPVQPLSDTVSVCKTDANNYCRILTALGMEEEGDPVAEVERLITERMTQAERKSQ